MLNTIILDNIKLDMPQDVGKDFLRKLMGGRLNHGLEEMLDSKKEICIKNIKAKALYRFYKIKEIKNNIVYFQSGHIFKSPSISKILKGSALAVIFIHTLGSKIDKIINQEKDTLTTITMDAIANSILELLGEYVKNAIKKEFLEDGGKWDGTCSYSPGQNKWKLEEQKEIFKMIDGSNIGVKLNKNYLMTPFKSISGVYGFGPTDKIDKTRIACDICPKKDCIGRR